MKLYGEDMNSSSQQKINLPGFPFNINIINMSQVTQGTYPPPTTTPTPWWRGSSFPYSQYKDIMPEDQFAKLIAMHENSAQNAAMYVAIVLAAYIVLLSLLLCRYVRRRPPMRDGSTPLQPLPPLSSSSGRHQHQNQSFYDRLLDCMVKPFNAMRHCTIRSGRGVASVSSEENEELHDHSSTAQQRRDSTVIRMNQLRPSSSPKVCPSPCSTVHLTIEPGDPDVESGAEMESGIEQEKL